MVGPLALLPVACLLVGLPCQAEPPTGPDRPYTLPNILRWHRAVAPWPWHFPPEQSIRLRKDGSPQRLLCVGGGARGGEFLLFTRQERTWAPLSTTIELSHHKPYVLPDAISGWHAFETYVPLWRSGGKDVLVSVYRWNGSGYALSSQDQRLWAELPPGRISQGP